MGKRISVTCPGGSWCNFDIKAEGTDELEAADVVVHNYGAVAWFPLRKDVDETNGKELSVKFGNLKNADADADTTGLATDLVFFLFPFLRNCIDLPGGSNQ